MASFKTSAIVELIDKTKAGRSSVIRNFGRLEKAAAGFGRVADKSADKASLSFKQFEFQQKRAQTRLNDLRSDLRNGRGDFRTLSNDIDHAVNSLKRLNRQNRGFRAGRAIGGNIRRGISGALNSLPIVGGALAATGGGALALTSNFARQADDAGRLADSVGFTVESYTALRFAARQLAGEEGLTALPDAVKELNKRIGELRKGEGSLVSLDKSFQSILLSADGTEDAFVKIRREIKQSGIDNQELGTTLDKLFGDAGFRLTRLFQVSNQEFGDLVNQAKELGVVLDRDAVNGGRRFLKELGEITTRTKAIGLQIGGALAEPFATFFDQSLEPRLKDFQAIIAGIEADDIDRAFKGVASSLEQSAKSVGFIFGSINSLAERLDPKSQRNEVLSSKAAFSAGPLNFFLTDKARNDALKNVESAKRGKQILADFQGSTSPLLPSVSDNGELAAQQRETNRLLAEMLGEGRGNLTPLPEQEGRLESGLNKSRQSRGFGALLDLGGESIISQ